MNLKTTTILYNPIKPKETIEKVLDIEFIFLVQAFNKISEMKQTQSSSLKKYPPLSNIEKKNKYEYQQKERYFSIQDRPEPTHEIKQQKPLIQYLIKKNPKFINTDVTIST